MTSRPFALSWDVAPGALFLAATLLFAPRLAIPAEYVFDEVYHAYTAGQYVAGNADAYVWYETAPRPKVAYMWNHPPAGILAMAVGILVWGDNSFGWRFASVIFGAAGVALAYLLAWRLTRDRAIAIGAALVLLCDGMYFAQSRVAMLDVFGTFFALGALYALHAVLDGEPERSGWPIVRTGVWLGLALATKWNASYLALFCGLAILARTVRRPRLWPYVAAGLAAAPLAVYLAVYVPFFVVGHTWSEWLELQKQIFFYHTRLAATHPWSSRWWEWPLALRPVWYWTAEVPGKGVANGFGAPNIALYGSFLPAVGWLAWRWRRTRSALVVLLIGFFGQWLPWALVPRIAFSYHFLPSVPFGALATAALLVEGHRRGGWRRGVAWAYAAIVIATFVFYYPILAGVPISREALGWRLWLPGWALR